MPIKIDNSGSPASFSVTATEVYEGMANFNEHYTVVTGPEYSGRDYTVTWEQFSQCITDYKAQFPEVPDDAIAVRFIHCYEMGDTTLYMRMLICQMELTTITEYSSQVYQLLDNNCQLWYEVKQSSITPCADQMLFNEQYLNSFMYKANSAADVGEILSEDGGFRFVRTLTYPWQNELLALYVDNGSPTPTDTNLHFAAASYTEAEPGASSVLWPHGLVMYLDVNGTVLLDDNNYVSLFHYKGADLGTTCPPRCGAYYTPPVVMAIRSLQG